MKKKKKRKETQRVNLKRTKILKRKKNIWTIPETLLVSVGHIF